MRLIIAMLACLLGAILPSGQAAAIDYPTRTVHMIIPFSAGGAPDVLLRLVAQKLSEKWGQGVVVENRPGGNTLIGTVAAAKSAFETWSQTTKEERAAENFRKHGVHFSEAAEVFSDDAAITIKGDDDTDEERFVTLGVGLKGRILAVVYCYRNDRILNHLSPDGRTART